MTTQEMVNYIRRRIGDALTRAAVLEILNNIQNEILAEDCQLMRVRPDPFFATTGNTYVYTASSQIYVSATGAQGSLVGDIRAVREIYSFDNDVNIFDYNHIDPASDKPNQVEKRPTSDKVSARFEGVDSIKPNSSDCKVYLWEGNDPGTTTVTWRALAYKWPAQLTSEGIDLSIPADFHHNLLLWGVLKEANLAEYMQNDNAYSMYERHLKRFRDRYNRMATQDIKICLPRDF